MILNLFSPCFLRGHLDPLSVVRQTKQGPVLIYECPRCLVELHRPLPKQKLRLRKEKRSRVITLAKRRSA